MIDITLHIEQLLVRHDCVIVPGLGGFVAQNCGASYIEEEGTFLPPYRSVTFNPHLEMNDGLLVQDIAQRHGLSYPEALNFVTSQVDIIHQTIQHEGKFHIYGVGILSMSAGKSYEFKPLTCGIASPILCGLDSFYIEPLEKTKKSNKLEIKQGDEDTFTVSFPKSILRYTAVAAVAAVFFFLCIAPIKTVIQQQGASEAGMFQQIYSLFMPQSNTEDQQTPLNQVNPENPATPEIPENPETPANPETPENPAIPATPAITSPATPFTIVLASSVPESGAKAMVEQWEKAGHSEIRIYQKGTMTRVVYGAYASQEEAHRALQSYRSQNPEFAEAWIYEIK